MQLLVTHYGHQVWISIMAQGMALAYSSPFTKAHRAFLAVQKPHFNLA